MTESTTKRVWTVCGLALTLALAGVRPGIAQAGQPAAPATNTTPSDAAQGSKAPVSVDEVASGQAAAAHQPEAGETVDRIIAIVNGDLILESDVDQERRFAAFQPFSEPSSTFTRDRAIERLINRALILQQAKLQPGEEIKAVDVTKQINTLRKDIPACKRYACETDAGWAKFLADHGFTPMELQQRWGERMQVLAYIENRFRMGIRIEPAEIKDYYEKTLLPEYAKQKATAPKLADISDRIQEILLQQRVSKLLADWLQSLRVQGTVQIMKPGEVAP